MKRFIGDALRKVETGAGGAPVSFVWKGRAYRIEAVLRQGQDFDYSPLAPKKDWRSRRHRNLFSVRVESGERFEIYCDRGTKLGAERHWVLAAEEEGEEREKSS